MYEFLTKGVILSATSYNKFLRLFPKRIPSWVVDTVRLIQREELIVSIDNASLAIMQELTGLPPDKAIVLLAKLYLLEHCPAYRSLVPILACMEDGNEVA